MKKIFLFLLFTCSAFLFIQAKPITSIPFIIEKNCIYFYAKVNHTDSIKFLFDTGANSSVINKQILAKLGLKLNGKSLNQGANGLNEVENSSGNNITFGSITKKEVSFTLIPYDTDAFDGVFGTDLMQGHIIEIDYNKQTLNFYAENDKTINFKNYTKLKLSTANYPTTIKSSVMAGKKRYTAFFGVDSGADDALTFASPFAKKNNFTNTLPKVGSASFQGSDGAIQELTIVLLPEVQIADTHLYRIPVALSTATEGIDATNKLAGFYGNALLKKFNIILDYRNHIIYLKLNKNLYQDYYE